MRKTFILFMSLVAVMAANLSAMAQENTSTGAFMGDDVIRSQNSFITDSKWSTGVVPASGSNVVIMANAVIPTGYIAVANEVSLEGGSITVSDGGQLRHNTDDLVVTMKKNIEPYSVVNGMDNYYLLGFPFSEEVAVPDDMTAEGCDFYKFNGDYPNAEWRNNRMHAITLCQSRSYRDFVDRQHLSFLLWRNQERDYPIHRGFNQPLQWMGTLG